MRRPELVTRFFALAHERKPSARQPGAFVVVEQVSRGIQMCWGSGEFTRTALCADLQHLLVQLADEFGMACVDGQDVGDVLRHRAHTRRLNQLLEVGEYGIKRTNQNWPSLALIWLWHDLDHARPKRLPIRDTPETQPNLYQIPVSYRRIGNRRERRSLNYRASPRITYPGLAECQDAARTGAPRACNARIASV